MLTLPLTKDLQHNKWKTILLIVKNNNVPRKLLIRLKQKIQYKIAHSQPNIDTSITKIGRLSHIALHISEKLLIFLSTPM